MEWIFRGFLLDTADSYFSFNSNNVKAENTESTYKAWLYKREVQTKEMTAILHAWRMACSVSVLV